MRLLIQANAAVKRRFGQQPVRIWAAMVGLNTWRAFVVNTESKIQVAVGPLSPSYSDSLQGLVDKLSAGPKKKVVNKP